MSTFSFSNHDNFGAIWKYFFKEDLEDTYGTYITILIDGKEYRINMASFESVAIMPDGEFISTLLDDPRDTYRVFQGIEIYEEMIHP